MLPCQLYQLFFFPITFSELNTESYSSCDNPVNQLIIYLQMASSSQRQNNLILVSTWKKVIGVGMSVLNI